jgi:hypothetical protein
MTDGRTEHQQIDIAWRQAFHRMPATEEQISAQEYLAAARTELTQVSNDNVAKRAMASWLRTLLGSNEFLHVD